MRTRYALATPAVTGYTLQLLAVLGVGNDATNWPNASARAACANTLPVFVMSGQFAFISYARADSEAARKIQAAIEAAGVRTWMDREEIAGGSWRAEIGEAIANAQAVIAIVSSNAASRPVVAQEISLAGDLN